MWCDMDDTRTYTLTLIYYTRHIPACAQSLNHRPQPWYMQFDASELVQFNCCERLHTRERFHILLTIYNYTMHCITSIYNSIFHVPRVWVFDKVYRVFGCVFVWCFDCDTPKCMPYENSSENSYCMFNSPGYHFHTISACSFARVLADGMGIR